MAKMIPNFIVDDKVSPAERKIFKLLKENPDTEGWTVLHSLGLAGRGERKPYGEIDFVMIIPKEGIVCLEIKGGGISCKDGEWKTTNRNGKTIVLKQSPFDQAKDSMFALRDSIKEHFEKDLRIPQCPIGYMVGFPDALCPPVTTEFKRWEVIDRGDIDSRSIYFSIMKFVQERLRRFSRSGKNIPTSSEAREIIKFLRPDFEHVPAKNLLLEDGEQEMLRLTEEQYKVIDFLEDNPRFLCEGAAGTGKTMISIEFSKRSCREGKKVLFICYNRLLSQWLKECTEGTSITTGTFHGVAEDLIRNSKCREKFFEKREKLLAEKNRKLFKENENKLYSEEYPLYGQMVLEELGPQFNLLVVDEAQDLLKEPILDFLNLAIHGGLSKGNWAIFGDFSHQNIYGKGSIDAINVLRNYCENFREAPLMYNCRNTRNIAEQTYRLSGFKKEPYILGKEEGLPVQYEYWKNPEALVNLLERKINNLLKEEISVEDIVVLSPNSLEFSSLSKVEKICGYPIEDCSSRLEIVRKSRIIKFSTIHSFKGLESRVIIIIDIKSLLERDKSLLYVSMSRAKGLLVLLVHEQIKDVVELQRTKHKEVKTDS